MAEEEKEKVVINPEDVEIIRKDERGDNTEKQLDVVEKVLKKGRRTFGSSGASLTHQISNPAYEDKGIEKGLAEVGLDGEHKTSKMLREWALDKPNVVLVDSVHIKGMGAEEVNEETGTLEGGDTDHVLIIGRFVILIDSKNWKKKRKYNVSENGEVLRSNKPFPGGKVSTRQALFLWKKHLGPYNPMFNSIINITSEEVWVTRDRNWWQQSFKVVSQDTFIEFLDKVWDAIPEDQKKVIDVNLVTAVVTHTIKPYDVVKEKIAPAAHLLNL